MQAGTDLLRPVVRRPWPVVDDNVCRILLMSLTMLRRRSTPNAYDLVDAENGRKLRSFQTSELWKASPMTYVFDNQQYMAVAAGSTIIALGLQ